MLFGYPEPRPDDNWIHECILSAVKNVHDLVGADGQLPDWPFILPEAYQDRLKSRDSLESCLTAYSSALRELGAAERESILDAMYAQNRIAELLAGTAECQQLCDLPEKIRKPVLDLFECGFRLLTALGTRQRQYEAVCLHIPVRVCPFCGCEHLEAPGLPQEDFDHFLPRKKYPFAAANLRNLAPMGKRCNSSYKLAKDPLRGGDGVRRRSFDPFIENSVSISFARSSVNENAVGPLVSEWKVDCYPFDQPEATWDDLFQVRTRWEQNCDENTVKRWLQEFSSFCKRSRANPKSDADLLDVAHNYQQYLSDCGFADQAFLKSAAFEMLVGKCKAGSKRLLPVFWDLAGAKLQI